jgi:transcriptional regulator with PAS, ATPase and Fis domain
MAYGWPGNMRELEQLIERSMWLIIICVETVLGLLRKGAYWTQGVSKRSAMG